MHCDCTGYILSREFISVMNMTPGRKEMAAFGDVRSVLNVTE